MKQWQSYEGLLQYYYKKDEGERSFEKVKKKGLLIKNQSHSIQKEKMIDERKRNQ